MIPRRPLLVAAGLLAALVAAGGPVSVALAPAARAADGEKDDGKGKKGRDGEKKGAKEGEKDGEKKGGGDGSKNGAKEDAKEKDPKDTPEGKECLAIGGEFERRDASALATRVRPKGKVRINLSGTSAEYSRDQASAVLDEWFQGKEVTRVVLRSVKDLQGELSVTWRARGSDTAERKTLLVTLEKRDKGEGYWLTRLELL